MLMRAGRGQAAAHSTRHNKYAIPNVHVPASPGHPDSREDKAARMIQVSWRIREKLRRVRINRQMINKRIQDIIIYVTFLMVYWFAAVTPARSFWIKMNTDLNFQKETPKSQKLLYWIL